MSSVTDYKYLLKGEFSKVHGIVLPADYNEHPEKYKVLINHNLEFFAKGSLAALSMMGDNFKEAFGAASDEIKNLAVQEREQEKQAYAEYLKAASEDQALAKQASDKILSSLDKSLLGIEQADIENLKKADSKQLLKYSDDLLGLSFDLSHLFDLLSALDKEGIDIQSNQDQFYLLKSELKEAIQAGDFKKIHSFAAKTKSMYQALTKLAEDKRNSIVHIGQVSQMIYEFENQVDAPFSFIFHNELSDQIRKEIVDENKEALARQKLIEQENELVGLAKQCQDLKYLSDQEEAQDILKSVSSILADGTYTTMDKYHFLEKRKYILNDLLIKARRKNPALFETKHKYDAQYSIAINIATALEEKIPDYAFSSQKAEQSLNDITQYNLQRKEKAEQAIKARQLERSIREVMSDMKYEYIGTQKKNVNGVNLSKNIYHLENGNVVTFTVTDKGKLNARVSGVKVNGTSENKSSQVHAMKHFCSKSKEIERRLKEKGVELDNSEILSPEEKYTAEIELPKEVSLDKASFIRQMKSKSVIQQALKQKEIK